MYIAHKCPKCRESDVVFGFERAFHKCLSCDYIEDEDTFHKISLQEDYVRELEGEIEDRYPFKDLFLVGNSIDLAIGYHVLGRFKDRDTCIKSAISRVKKVYDTWKICFSDFTVIEKRIMEYEEIGKRNPEESKKYEDNLKSARNVFKSLPNDLKEVCKE